MSRARKILLLGADGFIGRHIAFHLRAEGWTVLASARRVRALDQMGFETIAADLSRPETHDPAFWAPHLKGCQYVVNAAGLLTGSEDAFQGVHVLAPKAVYQAMPEGCRALLISAVGLEAETPFALYRRQGEALADRHRVTNLRPGLVLADSAYGGSALARGLAALPLVTPVVGKGEQVFNPIHATDLAKVILACLADRPGPGAHEIGGPERVTQAQMLQSMRRWLGLRPVPLLRMPRVLARGLARVGDVLSFGPISTTALDQLATGVEAQEAPLLERLPEAAHPRGFSRFMAARPAGTADLWHARLYLMKPALRLVLILLWLVSGLLGLFLPSQSFLPMIPEGMLSDPVLIVLARAGGVADLALAVLLAAAWRLKLLGWLQLGLVVAYTAAFTVLSPDLWLLPLGGLLKNLPILMLIWLFLVLEEER
ncbi:DoxX-like family protein [Nioella ostreopsis]|uniref:DoxX-like family protein n=1 Tax=Nioella ostreopsis TaxID=2448479 RepID=UPI000FD7EC7A|nr:DoxX-like family protein [Nioella ostreopsis]